MVGENLRRRISHGFVTRQITAEKEVMAIAQAQKGGDAPTFAPAGINIGGEEGQAFFDFMFKDLPAFEPPDADLDALAAAMKEPELGPGEAEDTAGDNTKIPAGFTYLGQFVDHDITLDLTPLSRALADPTMVKNFRTPGLDLDCVYGAGPGPFRFLFERVPGPNGGMVDGPKLVIGKAFESGDTNDRPGPVPELPNDLPRTSQGIALIGDHRNDENLLVAQTHLAFMKFHNAVVDHLGAGASFEEIVQTVRWHYQWLVLHDFVERLCGKGIVAKILHDGRKLYRFAKKPFMPWEFSAAAYRLGHSMVREKYSHNRIFRTPQPRLAEGTLRLLFRFTNLSGAIGQGDPTLPSNWVIDWRRFFELPRPADPSFEFNHSRKLDPMLAAALHNLPGSGGPDGPPPSLAARNLRRGKKLGLPSGQDVAGEMRKHINFTPITEAQLSSGPDGAVAKSLGFHKKTPLWYYILKEAQVLGGGEKLGPVGAQIVAEVFVGIVQGDETSYLSQPGWKPDLPSAEPGNFTMVDLLTFVAAKADPQNPTREFNPIGD